MITKTLGEAMPGTVREIKGPPVGDGRCASLRPPGPAGRCRPCRSAPLTGTDGPSAPPLAEPAMLWFVATARLVGQVGGPRTLDDAEALARFDKRMALPLIAGAVLPLFLLPEGGDFPILATAVFIAAWLVFVVDLVVYERRRVRYLQTWLGRFDLTVVVLTAPWFLIVGPVDSKFVMLIRLARIARLVMAGRGARLLFERLGKVALVAAGAVVIGAATAYRAEHATNPGFATFGDALWWGIVTLTTVGYGDIVPHTTAGRVTGVMIMITGISVLGLLAGSMAGFFGIDDTPLRTHPPSPPQPPPRRRRRRTRRTPHPGLPAGQRGGPPVATHRPELQQLRADNAARCHLQPRGGAVRVHRSASPGVARCHGPLLGFAADLRTGAVQCSRCRAGRTVVVHHDALDPTVRGEYTGLWSNRLGEVDARLDGGRATSALRRRSRRRERYTPPQAGPSVMRPGPFWSSVLGCFCQPSASGRRVRHRLRCCCREPASSASMAGPCRAKALEPWLRLRSG